MDADEEKIKKGICPACDSKLIYQEGCKQCPACGWTACSVG
ncbi:MAG: hypothetical protein WC488_03780 [Candidatus Micrarchaeia archaeon]